MTGIFLFVIALALSARLSSRMTSTLAKFLGDNSTVVWLSPAIANPRHVSNRRFA